MNHIFHEIKWFGLGYCDLKTMITNLEYMLRFFAVNINEKRPKPPFIYHVTTAILIAAYYYIYVFSVAWYIFTRLSEDRVAAIIVFSLSVTSHIAMVKLWFMYINQNAIQNVVSSYLACNAAINPKSTFSNNLNVTLRVVKKRALIFWCVITCNVIIYIINPLFKSGRHKFDDHLVFYGLEPMLESPNYEIAISINLCAIIFMGYATVHITCFFVILCGYSEAYMIALSKETEALWNNAIENNRKKNKHSKIDNVYKYKDVARYITSHLDLVTKWHVTHIHLVTKVHNVFKQSITIEMTSLMIGIIADLLGGLENTFLALPFSLLIVGMDCLSGQKVMDASVCFERAVYACKWENFNPTDRKKVLLILMNAQKTMKLSAGMVTLSTGTFIQIIRSIYSAYTALRSAVHSTRN